MPTKCYQKTSKVRLPDVHAIAKSSLLIIRQTSKFCPSAFLMMLIQSVCSGHASLNQMVGRLGGGKLKTMSKQGLWARFSSKSTAFLESVLHDLMEQSFSPVRHTLQKAGLQRIIVEDSTNLVLPKKNAIEFPAHGNAYGDTAGVKVDLAYDLMSGQCISHTIEKATEQDKTIGKQAVTLAKKGDLYLRDMGYFILQSFRDLESVDAHWLSRLPMNCNAYTQQGEKIETLLKYTNLDIVDIPAYAGAERHSCRLIAVRADAPLAEQKRKKRREDARKKGKAVNQEALTRDGWHIMITSLSPEESTVEELCHLYVCRWSIELQFRGLKNALNLKKALGRITNKHHIHALVLAAMIIHQLSCRFWNIYHGLLHAESRSLSLEKLLVNLTLFLLKVSEVASITTYKPDFRHIAYDKRKRSNNVNSGFISLT